MDRLVSKLLAASLVSMCLLSVGMKLQIEQAVAAEAIMLPEDNLPLNPPGSFSVTVSISTLGNDTSLPSEVGSPLWVDGLQKGTIFADHPRTVTLTKDATHQIEVAQSLKSSRGGAEYVALSNVWRPTASQSHTFTYDVYYLVQEKVMLLGSFQAPPDLASSTNACCTRSRWVTSGSPLITGTAPFEVWGARPNTPTYIFEGWTINGAATYQNPATADVEQPTTAIAEYVCSTLDCTLLMSR